MADPFSIMAIAGAGVSAVGSIFAGQSQAAMYNYQAAIARMNATIAGQQAAQDVAVGELQSIEKIGLPGAQAKGAARAAAGAGGLDVNSGSPAAVQGSIQQAVKLNEATQDYNAKTRAYGAQIAGINDTAQANLDTMAASSAETAGMIGAVGGVFKGFSTVLGQGQTASMVGMTPTAPVNLNPGGGSGLGNLGFLGGLY